MDYRLQEAINVAKWMAEVEGDENFALIVAEIDRLRARVKLLESREVDYESVLSDMRRLTRAIDVAMFGEEGAAKQPSLCDVLKSVQEMAEENREIANLLKGFNST